MREDEKDSDSSVPSIPFAPQSQFLKSCGAFDCYTWKRDEFHIIVLRRKFSTDNKLRLRWILNYMENEITGINQVAPWKLIP